MHIVTAVPGISAMELSGMDQNATNAIGMEWNATQQNVLSCNGTVWCFLVCCWSGISGTHCR